MEAQLELCKQVLTQGSSMKTLIKNAVFSSKMMANLINDILDLAKIDSCSFKFTNQYFNLVETVQQCFTIVQFQANQRNVNLKVVLDKSRPFVLRKVFSDQRRIQQVLLNFLSNSLKFTKNADVKVHL